MRKHITPELVEKTFEVVFRESSQLEISFEDAKSYNSEFKFTQLRTCFDVADLGPDLRILEVGVFTGVVSVTLARLGYLVSASDVPLVVSDPALQCFLGSEKIESCAVNLATTKLPYPDGSFDVIIFHSVLTHLNINPIPVLDEFHRVLGENGVVYCNTPNLLAAKNVWRMLSGKGYLDPIERLAMNLNSKSGMSVGLHWREWTKAELIDLFEYCGFELKSHRFAVTTPNRSKFPRKQLVGLMYAIRPAFMTTQIGLFRKRVATENPAIK